MTVARILTSKGARVATTRSDATIKSTADRLTKEGIGALVVTDGAEKIVGIVSERDIVRGLAAHGAGLLEMPVSALMTRSVAICRMDSAVDEVMARMTAERIRHVPVVDGVRLAGIVSIGDVVKHALDAMESEVRMLREYITH